MTYGDSTVRLVLTTGDGYVIKKWRIETWVDAIAWARADQETIDKLIKRVGYVLTYDSDER